MIALAAPAHTSTTTELTAVRSSPVENLAKATLLSLALFLLAGLCFPALAQQPAAKPLPASSTAAGSKSTAPTVKTAPVVSRPSWAELTAMQQQTLKPLAASWNSISEPQKRKWLEISKNYHSLAPDGQATMHSRMNEWVALSPQQRAEARLNFAKTKELSKQLTPEEKKAKWQTYQALSPEEKQKLAAKASARPTGAATAVKPVAPQKLAAVPPGGAKTAPKMVPAPAIGSVPATAVPATAVQR